MAALFEKGRIGGLEISNRMIRTASHEGLADESGRPTEEQYRFYSGFVKGGIGLIITGYAGISEDGKSALYHMTMIDKDELTASHKEMVDRLHAEGGKIVLQIAHCGRQTMPTYPGQELLAPSAIPCGFYKVMPRAMNEDDIERVVGAFASAAGRARDAGYDGVQIHGAHGYLLSTFLSRHANKRTDRWGGSLENRFRIVKAVLEAVRAEVGPGYPVLLKLNAFEKPCDGMKPNECVEVARMVEKTGCCDAIEISNGTNEDGMYMARGGFPTEGILKYMRPYRDMSWPIKMAVRLFVSPFATLYQPVFTQGYNLDTSAMVKKAVSIPVITVGGIRGKRFMDEAIAEGRTDYVSMARPLLLEPDLPNKFRDGVSETAACDNCNICVVATDAVPIKCHKDEFGS